MLGFGELGPAVKLALVSALAFAAMGCSCGSDDESEGTSGTGGASGGAGGKGGASAGGTGGSSNGGSGGSTTGGGGGTGGTAGSSGAAGTAGSAGASSDAGADASDAGEDATADAGPAMCSTAQPCSWKQAQPQTSPPTLAWAAAAYDPIHDQVILFGGAPSINGGTTTDETWAWNGTNWAKLTPANKPGARWTAGMVFDDDLGRIVLFGGLATDQAGSGLNDTWEWNGTDWAKVTTQNSPPARGVHGALAYDSVKKKVVLRGGGTVPGQTTYGDTWEYDGTNWAEVTGSGPSARVAPAIAYDNARNEVILFGGGTWNPYFGDTWKYASGTWSELTPSGSKPSGRQSARAVFDATRSLVLLFGGDNGTLLNDLWEWNGTSWSQVTVQGPPPRCCFAFAHDTKRGEAVLFGGPDNQTWIYGN